MRLINTATHNLGEFIGRQVPEYAILSHTWREEELTFRIWEDRRTRLSYAQKKGYIKIQKVCRIAARRLLKYVWVDTICINKESSAELSEAINSMFAWYREARVCFAWIDDFEFNASDPHNLDSLGDARWFTRGWTL